MRGNLDFNNDGFSDLDNDGIKDAGEPSTVTNTEGRWSLAVSKSDQDSPILASGGYDMGSGVANTAILKINSNLIKVLIFVK